MTKKPQYFSAITKENILHQEQTVSKICLFWKNMHCMKSVQIRSFFLAVFSCIRTRKNSVFGHFSRSDELKQNYFMNTLTVTTSLCDSVTLREKCPNTYFHVFSPNIGKHGPLSVFSCRFV